VRDSGGKVLSSRTSQKLTEEHEIEGFVAWAEKRGETRTLISTRYWYRSPYFYLRHKGRWRVSN
jgi:hypothetical protein